MNSRLLNRLLIGLCLLLLGWAVFTATAFIRYKATAPRVDSGDPGVEAHDGSQKPGERLGPHEEYSSLFEARTSLLSANSPPTAMPEPNWKVIRLIQTTMFRGTWEAIVEYPKNPASPRSRLHQKIVWVGDTLSIALTRPVAVKGRTRVAATTVTVSAIGKNTITFTDTEGRSHRIDI